MKDGQKEWVAPQLIVLGRGTPEENVLVGCKTSTLGGANATKAGCLKFNAAKTKCNQGKCSVVSTSS